MNHNRITHDADIMWKIVANWILYPDGDTSKSVIDRQITESMQRGEISPITAMQMYRALFLGKIE